MNRWALFIRIIILFQDDLTRRVDRLRAPVCESNSNRGRDASKDRRHRPSTFHSSSSFRRYHQDSRARQGRSGSTFLSTFFKSNPEDVLYLIEPCATPYIFPDSHSDYTGEKCLSVMREVLECDFSSVHPEFTKYQTLGAFFRRRQRLRAFALAHALTHNQANMVNMVLMDGGTERRSKTATPRKASSSRRSV